LIGIEFNKIDDAGLEVLIKGAEGYKGLKKLNLQGNHIHKEGAKGITAFNLLL